MQFAQKPETGADFEIIRINSRDSYYSKTLALRQKVLRDPLGMTYGEEELNFDEKVDYFIYVVGSKVLGCVGLVKENETTGRLMQMAVDEKLQGQNIGRKLVMAMEEYAKSIGFTQIITHARHLVMKFYVALGYHEYGETYQKIGVKHINMKKAL